MKHDGEEIIKLIIITKFIAPSITKRPKRALERIKDISSNVQRKNRAYEKQGLLIVKRMHTEEFLSNRRTFAGDDIFKKINFVSNCF